MKKIRKPLIVCLALFVMVIITSVAAGAASLDPVSLAKDFVHSDRYIVTHPREAVELVGAFAERDQPVNIDTNDEDLQAFFRVMNIPNTGGAVSKGITTTLEPTNTERGRILSLNFKSPANYISKAKQPFRIEGSFLNSPFFSKSTVTIDPHLVYKDRKNNLVVWAQLTNYSGQNIEISGIPEIQLLTGDKVLASGTSPDFDVPMKFSYYQKKINNGVYNGLPDQCFIKMTFEPGTYDDTIDISNLDNLDCQYVLNYRVID